MPYNPKRGVGNRKISQKSVCIITGMRLYMKTPWRKAGSRNKAGSVQAHGPTFLPALLIILLLLNNSSLECADLKINPGLSEQNNYSEPQPRDSVTESGPLYFNLNLGFTVSGWKPCDRGDNARISFDTEGLEAYSILSSLGFKQTDFLIFDYEAPFNNTPEQSQMLEVNSRTYHGFEKYTGGIKLESFLLPLIEDEHSLSYKILRRLFSLQFVYSKELFFGSASSNTNFYFVPLDAAFSRSPDLYSQCIFVPEGEKLNYHTVFKDRIISIMLHTSKKHDIRLGYFHSSYERPADYFTYYNSDTGDNIIMGTRYESDGILLGYSTRKKSSPGLNLDASFRFSDIFFNGEIETAEGDLLNNLSQEDDWFTNWNLKITLWYNYYFGNRTKRGLFFRIGIEYERRNWFHEYYPGESTELEELETILIDQDEILKAFGFISVNL